MADTKRGSFPDKNCSDCGEKGSAFKHWGPLLPPGVREAYFCIFCFSERSKRGKEPPRPLGVEPPGVPKEFLAKAIEVTTKSGSVYWLSAPIEGEVRKISCFTKTLDFAKGRVLCLRLGRSLWIKPRDSEDPDLWATSPVVSIKEWH